MSKRHRFAITLEAGPNQTHDESTRMLRAFLKLALRCYGLRCTSALEIKPPDDTQPPNEENGS
jgi:hypothetical protein